MPRLQLPPPDQLARTALPNTNVAVLAVGQKVACFQPPERWDRYDPLFVRSRVLNNPLERGTGWWIGEVVAIEPGDTPNDGPWAIVKDARSGKKWDCNGKEYPIYPFQTVQDFPEVVKTLFDVSDELGCMIDPNRRPRQVNQPAPGGPGSLPRRPGAGPRPAPPQGSAPAAPSLEEEFFQRPPSRRGPGTGPTGPQG